MTSLLTKLSCAIVLVLAVIPGSATSAGALSTGTSGLTCDGAWHIAASDNPASRYNDLADVAAVSPSLAWAVGRGYGGTGEFRGMIMRWDGASWTGVPSPHVTGPLRGVSAPDAAHAFAVGVRGGASGRIRTLIEQYDGVSWSVVPSPNRGPGASFFGSVSALSGSDAWAVGTHDLKSGAQAPLVEHWDGTSWSYVRSPYYHHSPQTVLSDVAMVSSNDVWAVGSYYSGPTLQYQPLAEHWDGTSWSIVPVASPGTDSSFSSLTALGAGDVWAVGGGDGGPFAEHWGGSSWSEVPVANPGPRSSFGGVAAAGSSLYATGVSYSGRYNTLAEKLNGSAFEVVSTPNVHGRRLDNELHGAASDGTIVWSVGRHDAHHARSLTLVEYVC